MQSLWRKADVAEFLNVSERTVERYVSDEGLPAMKPFGAGRGPVRYDPRAVRRWWAERCGAPVGSVGLELVPGNGD